jgi:protein-tyrosine phosphatase
MSGELSVDSAGTANYQIGKPPDPSMRKAAMARGYLLETEAKQLTANMVRESHLVIAMDRENLREIFQIARGEPKQVKMLSDFLDDDWPRDVPDPYRGPEQGFEYVLDMLEKACPAILDSMINPSKPEKELFGT